MMKTTLILTVIVELVILLAVLAYPPIYYRYRMHQRTMTLEEALEMGTSEGNRLTEPLPDLSEYPGIEMFDVGPGNTLTEMPLIQGGRR